MSDVSVYARAVISVGRLRFWKVRLPRRANTRIGLDHVDNPPRLTTVVDLVSAEHACHGRSVREVIGGSNVIPDRWAAEITGASDRRTLSALAVQVGRGREDD